MIFFAFFIKLIAAPVLFKKPTPSQINVIKKAKNHFLLWKVFKNTESAQLCFTNIVATAVQSIRERTLYCAVHFAGA